MSEHLDKTEIGKLVWTAERRAADLISTDRELAHLIRDLIDVTVKAVHYSNRWLPIETAPRDGTTVLCYFPLEGLSESWCRTVPVFYANDRWNFASRAASGFSREYEPSHWQPIVAPLSP